MKNTVIYSIVFIIVILGGLSVFAQKTNDSLSDELLRLHVIANSDNEDDQALKLKVRDSIISYLETQFDSKMDVEEARKLVLSKIDEIEAVAEKTIYENGLFYPVQAEIGKVPFPTKNYGDVTLPAGHYEALRVVIGDAGGQNWWCVLFPPLCFVDAVHGEIPEDVKKQLKEHLNDEEYKIITTAESSDNIPIKVKFRIVELFQQSKINLAKLFTRVLGS